MMRTILLGVGAALLQRACATVYGVNLGGWLVAEPWMNPSIFEDTKTDSEWSLCEALGKDKCKETLETHWSTYYSRDDLQQIKDAGLNAIRIPLGHWSVDIADNEPYVDGQYPYLVRAVQWAHELGLNVFIDLHGVPGSQNGWEESGLVGPLGFPDNSSNTDRTLKVLRNLTDEFTKDIYGGAVTNIEPMNEPIIDLVPLREFYTPAADVVGKANGTGLNITFSDGFFEPHTWENYDPWNPTASAPAQHMTIDTHQFWAFPPLDHLTELQILTQVCELGKQIRDESKGIPPTLVGEWSLSTGITANSSSNTADDQKKRTWFRQLFEAQRAAFSPNGPNQASIGWYFWAWKTEYDIDAWSYRKGLDLGYIPSDLRNKSSLIFPIKADGCIDETFKYTAPAHVQSHYATSSSSGSGPTGTSGSAAAASSSKGASSNLHVPDLAVMDLAFLSFVGLLFW